VAAGRTRNQLVVAEIVAVVVILAATSGVPVALVGVPVAAALAILGFGRWRGRWVYQWVGIGLRYAARSRNPADLVTPETAITDLIEDEYGIAAVLDLGDPAGLLGDAPLAVPSPMSLLPPGAPDIPGVQVQLLVCGAPGPALRAAAGIPATSYRQLTEGRIGAYQRILFAVRVLRDDRGWSDEDLRRAVHSTLRRVCRRLDQEGVPHRPVGQPAIRATLAELAGGTPVREAWSGLDAGGLRQVSLRVRQLAGLRAELAGQLVPRVLGLAATATTVSLAAAPTGLDLLVRVAAPSGGALTTAVRSLRRLLDAAGLATTRLDGEQLPGLAGTLPLGLVGEPQPAGALGTARIELYPAGVVLGRNRRGRPVTARLIRPEPTRVLLVGGVRVAELLTLRALAVGAHVLVQTARPYAWEPFLRAVSLPSDAIALVPPGQPTPPLPPAGPLAPQLVVVDVGPVPGEPDGVPWRTTVLVRDDLATTDLDPLARADLVILQPLRPEEAALAGTTLGLGEGRDWLTRIRADMIGMVNRRTVRFALLSPTPLEQRLIGAPDRAVTSA
jgi:ESX secretion system protein EccE